MINCELKQQIKLSVTQNIIWKTLLELYSPVPVSETSYPGAFSGRPPRKSRPPRSV